MSLDKKYNKLIVRGLLENLIEIKESKDWGCDGWYERGEIVTEDYSFPVYSFSFGLVVGSDLYQDLDELYADAMSGLKLDLIIEDYDPASDDLWVLCSNWETNLMISDEALRELYYTRDDAKRLNILERAIEACEAIGMPFIDRWAVKMSRQALSLRADEALRCL